MSENKKCPHCKRKFIPGTSSFVHSGLTFATFQTWYCAGCEAKDCIKDFERYGGDVVREQGGRPAVNWERYVEICDTSRSEERVNKINDTLLALGVFSSDARGNWNIVSSPGSAGLNPRRYQYLYFTRAEDVLEYAKHNFRNARYGWEIHRIAEVVRG